MSYPIAERIEAQFGEVSEVVNDGLIYPAPLVLEGLGQIPVIQGNHGNHT